MKREIDPQSWFGTREITGIIPPHFIKSNTPISDESYNWVVKKLAGRFGSSIDITDISSVSGFMENSYLYFEDPKEAMIYELRWSGGN